MDWGDESESGTEFTVMMWVPNYISDKIFNLTMHDLNERLGEIDFKIDLAIVPQRNCAQLLHEGSYQEIGVTKQKLLDEVERQKYKPKGMLQEIFMNHPCCNPPEKLKILIRQEIEL